MVKVYNTLTRRKEELVSLHGNRLTMYACGITVSGDAHIGHAYQALIYDVIRKYLIKRGFDVVYARNYTDVDDKIINRSREAGIPAGEYAAAMIQKIDAVMREFRVDDPDIWIKATESMDDIIAFVRALEEKGYAYATEEGDVYFSVDKFPEYGKLSRRRTEDACSGVRISSEENKRSSLDFALWKAAKEGEISWDSPWGKGRPGWHIECSAMNRAAFGDTVDIHGGGRDLIFPHHENEIAQSEALTGKPFARYWIHNGLVKVSGQKMSKSLGNSLLLSELLKRYSPETIKLALLQTHYRQDIAVTGNLFPDAERHLTGFYRVLLEAEKSGLSSDGKTRSIDEDFVSSMDDDFNTALAVSNLFGYFRTVRAKLGRGDASAIEDLNAIREDYGILGLFGTDPAEFLRKYGGEEEEEVPEEIAALAEERMAAKARRDYAEADRIRDVIAAKGYAVTDTRDGYAIRKKQ